MLTIVQSPALVALTGNPVRFKLQTDNQFSSPGAKYVFAITFSDRGVADNWFSLSWYDKSLGFVCKAEPDMSGLQIPDGSDFPLLNDWVAEVAVYLRSNYYISKDFDAVAAGHIITLTAREYGTEYEITLDSSWSPGTDPTGSTTAGSAKVARDFFKVGLQLLLKEGASWITVGEDLLPVDDSGICTFDIHRLFADQVYSSFQWMESSVNLLVNRPNQCREYRIRYFEQYGWNIYPGRITESTSFFILAAGISYLQEAIYNRMSQVVAASFWTKLQYNQYFLTWQPKDKLIDRWQTEKLYYLVRESIASLLLKAEINYNDETPKSTITKMTVNSPAAKGIYEVICTLNRLQLFGYDQDNIDFYRIWMEDGSGNRLSEIRTFRMDYAHHEEVRQFLFLNSLGGYDTLRITGDVEDSIELERSTISKVLGSDFMEQDHQVAQGSISETKTYKANTGWLVREQVAWIRDFFLSKQVYQIVVGKLVPVVVSTTQATQRKDREDLFAIDFEYRRAFQSDSYSMEIVSAQFSDDFNDDFANE
jgi:hypothetical protein